MIEGIHSYKMLVLTAAPRHNIPEDDILLCHLCENLKSYIENVASESTKETKYTTVYHFFPFSNLHSNSSFCRKIFGPKGEIPVNVLMY
jgi:hypothetical protein